MEKSGSEIAANEEGKQDYSFGGALKAIRVKKGMTQQQLAKAVPCEQKTISRFELGEQEPSWKMALMLAAALGVSINDLAPPNAILPSEQSDQR